MWPLTQDGPRRARPWEVVKRKGMKVKKEPIDPTRLRTVPRGGFSWIDRRFVREGFIEQLPGEAILLYFFLVAVSDAQGLSFYADPTTGRILKLDQGDLIRARAYLIAVGLILYRDPLYQVLPLPEKPKSPPRPPDTPPRGGDAVSLGEIFERALRRAPHG
jgi:hypothetical protein